MYVYSTPLLPILPHISQLTLLTIQHQLTKNQLAFVGGILGVSAGWMCDYAARVLSRANKGIFEPEFRILVNVLGAVLLGIGWFVWMWRLDNPVSNGYYLGSACYGFLTFGLTITSTTGGLYVL